jgi:hypothetical protein
LDYWYWGVMGTEEEPAPLLYMPGTLGRIASGLKERFCLFLSSSIIASISIARRMGNTTTIMVATAYHVNEPTCKMPERVYCVALAMVWPNLLSRVLRQNEESCANKPCAAPCDVLVDFLVFFIVLGIVMY